MRTEGGRTGAFFGITLLWASGLWVTPALAERAANHIRDVRVLPPSQAGSTASTEILIVGTSAPKFSARLVDGGRKLLIDIEDADVGGAPATLSDKVGLVGGVLTQAFPAAPGTDPTTRVAVSLVGNASYRIRPDNTTLHVVLSGGDAAAERAGQPAGGSTALTDVRFRHEKNGDSVRLTCSAQSPAFEVVKVSPTRSRVVLASATLPKALERTLDVTASSQNLTAVSTYQSGDRVVVEVEHTSEVTGDVARDKGTLVWTFARPGQVTSKETGIAPDGGAARRTRTVAREDGGLVGLPAIETSIEGGSAPSGDVREQRTSPSEAAAFLPVMAAQQGHYTGRRIDLDLKDADIHNVLRLLADVGKVNVVTGDNVSGTITIRMRNVPWDQALDVVLQSKNLGMVHQGNMIRVAPIAELEKERELAIARRKQDLELAPVETRLIPVSYAQASEIQARAREMLSPRGSISVDDRTNVLIARDVASNLNQLEELVRSLDTQTPQVLVEARIVEATSRYLRDVGIQWGGDATFGPATGNPTGLAFPSSVGLAGGASDVATPTAGLSPFDRTVANPNFAVNLPAAVGTGSGGALGLTFGSINNAVSVGVRLSAAESSGMIRIISSPRILTMDNKDARISQGTLIPFAQISAQGVQTTFQEAKLQLLVRPHVTADGSVAMHVKVNRDEPDFTQTSARGDPTILKREAETDLLIMDGHTAVIGGIYTRNTGRNLDQVPFFGDIPILGLLFQRRRASDARGELVIFLTPRIVNRAEALGH